MIDGCRIESQMACMQAWSPACQHVPTWNVDECPGLKRSWDVQDASKHAMDGSQVSELPVSKQPVKGLAGVPMLNSP